MDLEKAKKVFENSNKPINYGLEAFNNAVKNIPKKPPTRKEKFLLFLENLFFGIISIIGGILIYLVLPVVVIFGIGYLMSLLFGDIKIGIIGTTLLGGLAFLSSKIINNKNNGKKKKI
jgi:hypothetical protein